MQLNETAKIDTPDELAPLPPELTYAVMLGAGNTELAITDFMIRRACERMDDAQQFPFCSIEGPRKRRAS